jgi:hypothetical protein
MASVDFEQVGTHFTDYYCKLAAVLGIRLLTEGLLPAVAFQDMFEVNGLTQKAACECDSLSGPPVRRGRCT